MLVVFNSQLFSKCPIYGFSLTLVCFHFSSACSKINQRNKTVCENASSRSLLSARLLLSANSTHRILNVNAHCLVLLLLARDLAQLSVHVLAVLAQLCVVPLREDGR